MALLAAVALVSCGEPHATTPRQHQFRRIGDVPLLEGTPDTWDASGPQYPVVFAEDGRYYLYYSSAPGYGQRLQVGLATATSPLGPWTKLDSRPILAPNSSTTFDDEGIFATDILRDQDMLFLFFSARGFALDARGWHIGVALSDSPTGRFTKSARGAIISWGGPGEFDSGGQNSPSVVDMEGEILAWFRGWTVKTEEPYRSKIGFAGAAAPDISRSYTKEKDTPALSPGRVGSWDRATLGRPTVVRFGERFHMWYGGYDDEAEQHGRIGYAVSDDGADWLKAARPVLEPGLLDTWDQDSVAQPFVLIEDDTVYLYYVGTRYEDGGPVRGIGVAVGSTDWLDGASR